MDFEWDTSKELANRKKHGVGFRTAAKVFVDPLVIEFDDPDVVDEPRFNAIGLVDGSHALCELHDQRRCGSNHFGKGSGAA